MIPYIGSSKTTLFKGVIIYGSFKPPLLITLIANFLVLIINKIFINLK